MQTRPDLRGTFGMVSSTHWIASAVGQSVLERGGNAFDAAVAAGFVLHVVEPHLNGPGGDLVGLFQPAGGAPTVLAGQGPAPAAATIEHYRGEGLDLVPGAGALAAAVPGAVDAWLLLLRDHGTWGPAEVLGYAAGYAEHGHPVLDRVCRVIDTVAELFRRDWPSSAELWLTDDRPPEPGATVRNPAYAATLAALIRAAGTDGSRESRIDRVRAAWSQGFVAERIGEFVAASAHRHSTGTVHRGVLTAADLAAFSATYERPVSRDFRGTTVFKAPGWTQGAALLQALALLDDGAEVDLDTAEGVHRTTEALALALADRDAHYGDDMPPERLAVLLSDEYAAARRALIGDRASAELRPGRIDGREPWRPPLRREHPAAPRTTVGGPTVDARGGNRGDTCHVDVIDRWANAVAVTPSGGWLQSSPAVPGLGFCLGTRLQMTWLDPAAPSALVPGRRPRTTLSPTLLRRGEEMVSALGTPGGDQQDQWQLLYLLRVLAGGRSPQQAIDAPAFHTTSFPESFWPRTWDPAGLVVEDRLGEPVLADLAARGYRITRAGDWSLGRLCVVGRDDGVLFAAANPRAAQGYAVGR